MIKRLILSVSSLLIFFCALNAQKIYTLDEVNRIPFIDETNMQTIAISIADIYKKIIKNPDQYSTDASVKNTIYLYYDTDGDGFYNKINPSNGVKYSVDKKFDIERNDRLLFDLHFSDNGQLVVPNVLYVISHRKINDNGTYKEVGLISFELPISDSIKSILQKVVLQRSAAVNKNSLNGSLSPVSVFIPFNLSCSTKEIGLITGTVVKRGDKINISVDLEDSDLTENEKSLMIDLLKSGSDLMQCDKGKFQFGIQVNSYDYHIDFNIGRDMGESRQPTSFSLPFNYVKFLTGNGKKAQ